MLRRLTTACTRPATRRLSNANNRFGGRVVPGVGPLQSSNRGNMKIWRGRTLSFNGGLIALPWALCLAAGCMSVKPIYNDKEQAKAERAVAEFHRLHNEENYEGLYNLLDVQARQAVDKAEFVSVAKQTYEKWGKVQSVSLSQAKVFPSPLQVRMIYNVKYEKGDGQEWFIWNTQGGDARLLQYRNSPGFDTPDAQK